MRVGLNALFLLPGKVGGTEIVVRRLLPAIAAAAPSYEFILYVAREAAGTFELPPNVREVRCEVNAENRPARIAYEQTMLPWRARRDRVDILHSLGYTAPLVAHCPMVVTQHDLNYHFHPEDWSRSGLWANRALMPLVARRATRVITSSHSSALAIHDVLGIPESKIDVIYLGVDGNLVDVSAPKRAEVRAKFGLDGDFLLTVTASHPHKNLDGLLAAYADVCRRMKDPPPLVVVGIKGRDHERVERAAIENGRVVITGWVDDETLSALYRETRLFVFASKYEGFGFPPLEAMSVNVPVASSTAASLIELVEGAAITFDPEKPSDIAAAIVNAWTDEAARSRAIARGAVRAAAFRWERTAAETLSAYARACA